MAPEITSRQEHGSAFPMFTLSHDTNLRGPSGISDTLAALPSLLPHLVFLHPNRQTRLTQDGSHKKRNEIFLMESGNIRL